LCIFHAPILPPSNQLLCHPEHTLGPFHIAIPATTALAARLRLIPRRHDNQADSGLECPSLTGATKPVENIPKFDSKIWPVATTILSTEIGALIPNDVNIFVDETTKLPRSIDETTAFVCELLKKQNDKEAAAA
jgi:hypothetical protein